MLGLLLATALLGSLPNPTGIEGWNVVSPPGGRAALIAVDKASGVAFAYDSFSLPDLFKSADGGRTWVALAPQPDSSIGYALAVSPSQSSHLLAANTSDPSGLQSGIARSTDGGDSWVETAQLNQIFQIAYDPSSPATAYALASTTVLYRSLDDGVSWVTVQPPIGAGETFEGGLAISRDGELLLPIFSPAGDRLLRSADRGATWSSAALPGPTMRVVADPVSDEVLYALATNGLFRSADRGTTWTRRGSGVATTLAIDPTDPATLYAAGRTTRDLVAPKDGGLWKSTDAGLTWKQVSTPLPPLAITSFVGVGGPDPTVWAGTSDGILRSADRGETWSVSASGLPGLSVSVTIDPFVPRRLYAAGDAGGITRLYRSDDGGQRWTAILFELGDPGYPGTEPGISVAVGPSQTLYAAVTYCITGPRPCSGGILVSDDGGATWSGSASSSLGPMSGLIADPAEAGSIYATPYDPNVPFPFQTPWQLFRTSTLPQLVPLPGPADDGPAALLVDPTLPSTLFAASCGGGVFASLDRGTTWTARNAGLIDLCVTLARAPSSPGTLYASAKSGIFLSADRGMTWKQTGPFVDLIALVIDPIDPFVLYGATPSVLREGTASRVLRSLDRGATWEPFGKGLPEVFVDSLTIDSDGSFLYAVTQGGLYDLRLRHTLTLAPRSLAVSARR